MAWCKASYFDILNRLRKSAIDRRTDGQTDIMLANATLHYTAWPIKDFCIQRYCIGPLWEIYFIIYLRLRKMFYYMHVMAFASVCLSFTLAL